MPRETRNERLMLDSTHNVPVRVVCGAVTGKGIEADQNTLVGRVCGGVSDRRTRVFLIA